MKTPDPSPEDRLKTSISRLARAGRQPARPPSDRPIEAAILDHRGRLDDLFNQIH